MKRVFILMGIALLSLLIMLNKDLLFNLFNSSYEYYEDGNIKKQIIKQDDYSIIIESFRNGNKKKIYRLNKVKDTSGLVVTYYENGTVKDSTYMNSSIREGMQKAFFEDGKLQSEKIFQADTIIEEYLYYYRSNDSLDYIEAYKYN